jgi:hypothetical protein
MAALQLFLVTSLSFERPRKKDHRDLNGPAPFPFHGRFCMPTQASQLAHLEFFFSKAKFPLSNLLHGVFFLVNENFRLGKRA